MKKWNLVVLSFAFLTVGCLEMPLWPSHDKPADKPAAAQAKPADAAPTKPKVKPEDVTAANARQMADALAEELAEAPAKRP